MSLETLTETLEKHRKWLHGEAGGERASLYGARLTGASLERANLTGASLYGANLERANLTGARLTGANLYGASLERANLTGASLERANLTGASLERANLTGASLYGANLYGASLERANLYGANLERANLTGARLTGANLYGARLPHFQIPQQGSLVVYKKLRDGCIATLEIPPDARRTATPVGRKCRAEFAYVVAIENDAGEIVAEARAIHDESFKYETGKVIYPDKYDDDIRVECTRGIHFFLTREEAEEYS